MKRSLLDITQKISRKPGNAILIAKNLTDSTYYIFEATGWRLIDLLREIEYRETQNAVKVYINTQTISSNDYVIEMGPNGLLFKFIKSRFEYNLDNNDFIEVKGDIERYA